jgi:hypothetical protein
VAESVLDKLKSLSKRHDAIALHHCFEAFDAAGVARKLGNTTVRVVNILHMMSGDGNC